MYIISFKNKQEVQSERRDKVGQMGENYVSLKRWVEKETSKQKDQHAECFEAK